MSKNILKRNNNICPHCHCGTLQQELVDVETAIEMAGRLTPVVVVLKDVPMRVCDSCLEEVYYTDTQFYIDYYVEEML